ncbi:hypothetical protein L210DRAFT_2683917 [Boletus edulis BED1]|uniref:Uncharacterized protein n=1 Tax=Boletus edulis BED1 TaxID=1328754 RepID=A0AAD4BM08_BOLED|nr:hypothetical protein L210DRAFT_2683917 [Boletus edulis BED1]
MVVLIKNNVASVEGVAHLSLSPAGRVAERCTPSLRDAGVPREKSLPQRTSNPTDSVSPPSVSSPHPSSQAPSSISLTGQPTVASTVPAKPARSPEFSDEESPRESSNFSFHFDQYEEWTDEVEARMQEEIDRMLEDARRVLAEPVINISELFPDDLLADSSRFGASSYSGDQEGETEEEDRMDIDIVWEDEELVTYGPARPLTPIPEESLADEFVVHSPPLSCETISVHKEYCQEPLRRKPRRWVADLEEGLKVQITTKSSAEPLIPRRPPDVYLRQRRRRWKPPDSSRRRVAAWKGKRKKKKKIK